MTHPNHRGGDAPPHRRDRILPRLQTLFATLYGNGADAQAALAALETVIENAARARPPALAELDQARTKDPGWYRAQTMIGYCCYADRFAGGLAGLRARIPYLRALGVTYLHVLPFLQARSGESDGGFAVADYAKVDPRFGTDDDLIALTADLAAAGITLCADLVLNHTADDHAWARAALAGDPKYRAYYRLFPDRTVPDRFETTLPQVFPDTAPGNFTWVRTLQAWAWTTFYPYQWDLNWENPAVLLEFTRIILALANRGVGAFRLDSAPFLWKRPGTACQNEPETHLILQLLRAVVDIAAPGVLLKAEAVVPARDLPAYFGLPDAPGAECHLAYQTSLMSAAWASLARQDTILLRRLLQATPALGEAGAWLTYVRCHDDIGWRVLAPECCDLGLDPDATLQAAAAFFTGAEPDGWARGRAFQANGLTATNGMAASLCGIEAALDANDPAALAHAEHRLLLLYALAFAAPGLPVIYMGDELAQLNDAGPAPDADGRWLHRPAFDNAAADQALHGASTTASRIFAALQALATTRAALPDLRADAPLRLLAGLPDQALGFTRGARFTALFNLSTHPLDLRAHLLGTARTLPASAARETPGLLPPWTFQWLQTNA